jgi:hypothetical protein
MLSAHQAHIGWDLLAHVSSVCQQMLSSTARYYPPIRQGFPG